jgi:hypothetical protein
MAPKMAPISKDRLPARGASDDDQPRKPNPITPPKRLGVGEYFHPTLYDKATIWARLEFLALIERLAEGVLVDLATNVRPFYESQRHTLPYHELLTLSSDRLRKLADARVGEFDLLQESVEEKYHLKADWVRDTSLRTLWHWTGARIVVPNRTLLFTPLSNSGANPLTPEQMRISFSDYGWEMTNETRSAFVKRIQTSFESFLDEYVALADKRAIKAGWKKTPALRRSARNSDTLRHLEWFVRWQIQEWTTTQIADEYGLGYARTRKSPKIGRVAADAKRVTNSFVLCTPVR